MSGPSRLWGVVALLIFLHFFLHIGLGLSLAAPDLLTVALLVGARDVGMGGGAALGFFLGLLEDAFNALAFGSNALALTVVGAVGARTRDLFVGDSMIFLASYLFVGKWIRDLLHWAVVGEGLREPFVQAIIVDATLGAVYATAIGIVAFSVSGARWEPPR